MAGRSLTQMTIPSLTRTIFNLTVGDDRLLNLPILQ